MKNIWISMAAVILCGGLLAGCSSGRDVDVEIDDKGVKVEAEQDGKKVNVDISDKGVSVKSEDGSVDMKSSKKDGKVENHAEGNDGNVDMVIDGEEGKMTYKSSDGEGTYEYNTEMDLSELGVPIYKGAEPKGGAKWDQSGENAQSVRNVTLLTGDPKEKVVEFYKKNFKADNVVSAGAMHVFTKEEDGRQKSVMVQSDPEDSGKTAIVITVAAQ